MKNVRCAIYTRKSSEEGLEQDFNSLDAQHEACAAYIASQASEGWKLGSERYDDGGLSGGTLERPALQRLLEDVRLGRVDIIVVYKVDRLTRSLLDFAKLVETFDKADTSFVSVTQSFNTTNSMGRLTLNMLLSFAQFEREVTAERIRDKIAASKAKGMWMGGVPPLGYEPDGRRLKIVDEHAAIVRDIFTLYLKLENVRLVEEDLISRDIRSPTRTTRTGKVYGGRHLSRGQIYAILRNPIYIGKIPHKDTSYDGLHKGIIEDDVWEQVQTKLQDNNAGKRLATRRNTSPLAGLLFCDDGDPLIPVHSTKGTKRYRYYVSKAHQHGKAADDTRAIRIPASEIEKLVLQELNELFANPTDLIEQLGPVAQEEWYRSQGRGPTKAITIKAADVAVLIEQIVVHADRLDIQLKASAIAKRLGARSTDQSVSSITQTVQCQIKRSGRAMRLVDNSGAPAIRAEAPAWLAPLLAKAHRWWGELASGEIDIATLSKREDVTSSYATRVVRLAFLSPNVVEALLKGEVKPGFNSKSLLVPGAISPLWADQEERFLQDRA